MKLADILLGVCRISDSAVEKMLSIADEVSFRRGSVIIDSQTVDRNVYFVKRGLVRAYVDAAGREVTFWFGEEGAVVVSMESYVNGLPGYETVEAIEDTELYRIRKSGLESLYGEDIEIANWGRKFAEKDILRAEKCLIPHLYTTATERYADFVSRHGTLLNRLPLEYVASYLGITPVSLSRIRGRLVSRR